MVSHQLPAAAGNSDDQKKKLLTQTALSLLQKQSVLTTASMLHSTEVFSLIVDAVEKVKPILMTTTTTLKMVKCVVIWHIWKETPISTVSQFFFSKNLFYGYGNSRIT